jgi:FeS assembly SUF system regulator
MLRLPKLTDYAVMVLVLMADAPDTNMTAPAAAEKSGLPLPTVAKILKRLTKGGLLVAQRGTYGGYRLSRPSHTITIADVVGIMDGPVTLTDCVDPEHRHCGLQARCALRGKWNALNAVITRALQAVTLADMSAGDVWSIPDDLALPAPVPAKLQRV